MWAGKSRFARVARLAEVSVGTVSNLLNGAPNVSEATRRRVSRVNDHLDFTPDVTARSLISPKRPEATDPMTSHLAEVAGRTEQAW